MLYVNVRNTTPAAPFSDWATAATNIQDAVDAAVAGDEIVVTNGVYQTGARAVYGMSNRVAVTKPVTVRSVNGPDVTSIVGHGPTGDNAIRCVYLTNGAVLAGFTLRDGGTQDMHGSYKSYCGGGAWCEGLYTVLSNCVISGCQSYDDGAGVFGGTLYNCSLVGNDGFYGGGAFASTLNNCRLGGNWGEGGGGAYASTLNNCTIEHNDAWEGGGAMNSTLNNCVVIGNCAKGDYGAGGGALDCTLHNCTLAGNSAVGNGGVGGGTAFSTLTNCIAYYNTAAENGANYYGGTLNYSCTTPDPWSGVGNITSAPLFVDTNGWSNLRLQSNSPCINAGNNAYVTGGTDLDGSPRIAGSRVDIGAYEFQGTGLIGFPAWLWQRGLKTDGSSDAVDSDADGLNNGQEWRAGTDPTNALSVLRLISSQPSGTNVVLNWQSVAGVLYSVEWSTNLGSAFQMLSAGVPGSTGITTFIHTNGALVSPRFYRVSVP